MADAIGMSRYSLSRLKFTSPYFSAMDCVLNDELAIYCSSELTSGKRLYDELQKHGLKEAWQLRRERGEAWFEKSIVEVNKKAANKFAASVRASQADKTHVISPAPFVVKDWDQPEYLAFWEEFIRTRAKSVRFNKNWGFSNGCTFEFVVALHADIPTFDSDGTPLGVAEAIRSIGAALEQLESGGFDSSMLQRNFQELHSFQESQQIVRQSISLPTLASAKQKKR